MSATLTDVIAELRNYKLNGSDPVKQIRGIYADLETATREARKLRTALKELAGFTERNVERAKKAFEAEQGKPHDADSTDLDVAESRYHDAQRFHLVVSERVREALAP